MRLGLAIAIGVLGGAALAWWLTPAESRWNPFSGGQRTSAGPSTTRATPGEAPVVYRWRDARGVLHVTQQPPSGGQAYERVDIPEDRNIVPLGVPVEAD